MEEEQVVGIVTERPRLAERVKAIVERLGGRVAWLPKPMYLHAYATLLRCAGPYPARPVFVVLDFEADLQHPWRLADQLEKSRPPIPVFRIAPADKVDAFRRTVTNPRSLWGLATHADTEVQLFSDQVEDLLSGKPGR